MLLRNKLFKLKNIYDLESSDEVFTNAMKACIAFHHKHCKEYMDILDNLDFDLNSIKTIDDIYKIPPMPTSYLKNHTLLSKPYNSLLVHTTSSGTGGIKTLSGLDFSSGFFWLSMILKVFRYHKMFSLRPTNYIILGYQPDSSNQTAMAKILKASVLLAPKKEAVYALSFINGEYSFNLKEVISSFIRFSKENLPIRIIGFPAYLKLMLDELRSRNIQVNLNKHSLVIIGGGWKNLFSEEISKEELFTMAEEVLGITRDRFKDHFSTAEHPISYIACKNNHFHLPIFSRVIIRDVRTLEPLPYGKPGLLNLITPILTSMPYASILTDDIAVLRDGSDCGCGLSSPYFELIGRVGLASIKTCAQAASEFLDKV